ncbi:hypothetical protein W97_05071 [Coniosporium apollinis CBS 100218]|uniref:F-box domain-containing protein n=1 Tax=Coniosporium apollinis (strain CBS 100218) TaxID=1168221 RepID=R7YVJ0_CONA1|nr:uncharacterized protein W97_05071 [Coniosporium apollinis CBS 100218]EON65829.1 hypothetical protein W97_05071 [Coniosporium apollinis CBS 100218]
MEERRITGRNGVLSHPDRHILELLLFAAFEARTPAERLETMVSYYDYGLIFWETPELFTSLRCLAPKAHEAELEKSHCVPELSSSGHKANEATSMSSLPNEVLDQIFRLVLSGTKPVLDRRYEKPVARYKLCHLQQIPLLLVSHQFFELGVRHLLTKDFFVFESQKADRQYYADRANMQQQPGARPVAPDDLWPLFYPIDTHFAQKDGVLLLDSLIKTPFHLIPDLLPLITKVCIEIELPPIRMFFRRSRAQPGNGSFVTHPFLQADASTADVME